MPRVRPIDVVAADLGVDGGMDLDAGHLRAGEQPSHVDVMNVVAGDPAEDRAQAADDARLLAMRDVVVAHDVVADVVLGPAVFQGPLDGLDVAFGRVLRGVVPLVAVLSQRDADASRVADVVVLDDPAFAPVGADQADLFGGGRGPGRGGVHHREAAHGDVIDARLVGIEHGLADVDFDLSLIRIDVLELRPDRGAVLIHLGKPQRRVAGGLEHLVQFGRFGQPVPFR